jgi:hypothetical protein
VIESTEGYKKAIVADARQIFIKAIIDIIDPDIIYGTISSSGEMQFSKREQAYNKIFVLEPYATLEQNRWVLDGQFKLIPEQGVNGEIGLVLDPLSAEDGTFTPAVWAEETFSNVSILQACSIYFPSDDWDGVAEDFTVEIKQGGTTYHSKSFKGNMERSVSLTGFTVYNPDAIRVTVSKWSKPGRRARFAEILPGVYEEWDGNIIASFSLKHQGDVSCMALPYGTCTIRMDNLDRRFEPRSKEGVFQSIEERQGIDVSMAVRLEDGTDEYKRLGIFYQYSGGWKTGDNGLTMQWDLVDIIGLLQSREFIPPEALPTTLKGWIAALVAQLGTNFETLYTVDPNYADKPVVVRSSSDVVGMKCGDLLRYVCMATGTWPRADAETGYLAAEPLWSQGNKLTLDNLQSYPVMKANNDIAAIIFTLNDGNNTQYIVSGNSTASSETKSVQNPFIKTKGDALTAAKLILSCYGGNRLEIVGRGDMTSEIGDVDTVWLNESSATTARRIQQDLSLKDGVLKDCTSILLQADGSFLFQNRAVITQSGSWTVPEGATKLRLILVGKGGNGTAGTDGNWDEAGQDGQDGLGALVWAGTVSINPQQQFNIQIDEDTIFGQYSSADGSRFEYGYTDIASGDSFARTGVQNPVTGSGDGGAGGAGGIKGNKHRKTTTNSDGSTSSKMVIDNYPGEGMPGKAGATGCVVIYWDKEET